MQGSTRHGACLLNTCDLPEKIRRAPDAMGKGEVTSHWKRNKGNVSRKELLTWS